MLDSCKRQIEYARISLTDLCDMRCRYCMPECGVEKKDHLQILNYESLLKITSALNKLGINKFRLTGGEPLVRRGVVDFVKMLKRTNDIKVALTTNAQKLDIYAKQLKNAGLDNLNISLDTLNPNKYEYITRCGNLDKSIKGIKSAIDAGFEGIKINSVVMKNINDDEFLDMQKFCNDNGLILRFVELMPMKVCQDFFNKHFVSLDCLVERYNLKRMCEYDTHNSICYENEFGRVYFIASISHKFCNKCNRVRLTADGKLIPCLHDNLAIDLKDCLDDEARLLQKLKDAIYNKPVGHKLNDGEIIRTEMNSIGG